MRKLNRQATAAALFPAGNKSKRKPHQASRSAQYQCNFPASRLCNGKPARCNGKPPACLLGARVSDNASLRKGNNQSKRSHYQVLSCNGNAFLLCYRGPRLIQKVFVVLQRSSLNSKSFLWCYSGPRLIQKVFVVLQRSSLISKSFFCGATAVLP